MCLCVYRMIVLYLVSGIDHHPPGLWPPAYPVPTHQHLDNTGGLGMSVTNTGCSYLHESVQPPLRVVNVAGYRGLADPLCEEGRIAHQRHLVLETGSKLGLMIMITFKWN